MKRPRKTHLWLWEPDAILVCGLFLSFITKEDWAHGTNDLARVTCKRCRQVAGQGWVTRQAAGIARPVVAGGGAASAAELHPDGLSR